MKPKDETKPEVHEMSGELAEQMGRYALEHGEVHAILCALPNGARSWHFLEEPDEAMQTAFEAALESIKTYRRGH